MPAGGQLTMKSYLAFAFIVCFVVVSMTSGQDIQPPAPTIEWIKRQYTDSQLQLAQMVEFAQNLIIENRKLKSDLIKMEAEIKALKEK